MKKKLESELMSIAHRILKLKGREDVNKLHAETAVLFEKLSVLKFLLENTNEKQPLTEEATTLFSALDDVFSVKETEIVETAPLVEEPEEEFVQNDEEVLMEPVMEKIKDIVAQMPDEADAIESLFEAIQPKTNYHKTDFEEITADFKETPVFEPVARPSGTQVKLSLNDKLKSGGLTIGLNDKLAFIKQLFDGSSEDYDRVIAQVNTCSSFEEAQNLIQVMVKSEYQNWKGKEVVEERFMQIIEGKFN